MIEAPASRTWTGGDTTERKDRRRQTADKSIDHVLVCGSRAYTADMLMDAEEYVGSLARTGKTVIVVDGDGLGATVVNACERYNVPVSVYGSNGCVKFKAEHGKNLPFAVDQKSVQRFAAIDCQSAVVFRVKGSTDGLDWLLIHGKTEFVKEYSPEADYDIR